MSDVNKIQGRKSAMSKPSLVNIRPSVAVFLSVSLDVEVIILFYLSLLKL